MPAKVPYGRAELVGEVRQYVEDRDERGLPTDKVLRAFGHTVPEDCYTFTLKLLQEVTGAPSENLLEASAYLGFFDWIVVSTNPWRVDLKKISIIRRLHVLEGLFAITDVYTERFMGDPDTPDMELIEKVKGALSRTRFFGLAKSKFNEIIAMISNIQQIPIIGVILALDLLWQGGEDATKAWLVSFDLHYSSPKQRFTQMRLI